MRLAWVAAELAMATGDGAPLSAMPRRRSNRRRPAAVVPARHRVVDVVLAAALCSAGAVARARAVGEGAFMPPPSVWALPPVGAVRLLIDIGTVTFSAQQLLNSTKYAIFAR